MASLKEAYMFEKRGSLQNEHNDQRVVSTLEGDLQGFRGGSLVKKYLPVQEHRLHPRSGRSPHASEQLSPCATASELTL